MPFARIVIAALALCLAAAGQGVSIRTDGSALKVEGWQAGDVPAGGWSAVFAVYAGGGDVPPMLGSYGVENGALVFRPRFPLAPGVRYRAVFHPPGGAPVERLIEIPKTASLPSTCVEHVYPSTGLLPDNQLKFYVYFSAPMRSGEAWKHIRLLDESGATVDLPFLEIDQELWDREYRRLTILFDPGRIKRGVTPREEVGPAIVEGRSYTLTIDRDWPDAGGVPLRSEFRKPFRVGPARRTPPEPSAWQIRVPKAGSLDPLEVRFPSPMDFALLEHSLSVSGVAGTVAIDENETRWRFTAREPWKAGRYHLLIDTALEDLAGNRIGQAFDVDTFDRVSKRLDRKTVSLPFRIE